MGAYGYGNDAECLSDETFNLLRCDFCGEDIDAADLLPQDAIDRLTHGLLAGSLAELLPPWTQSSSEPAHQDLASFGNACQQTDGED